jgi:hypothetical protein
MSLISTIKSRILGDLINEGQRVSLTGTVSAGADQVVFVAPANRAFVITGVVLSTDNAAANLVAVGFKKGAEASLSVVGGYITSGSMLNKTYAIGDWRYGDLNYNVVISADKSNVSYTIDGRVISSPAPLGYVQHEGAKAHCFAATFGPESGKARGQTEVW